MLAPGLTITAQIPTWLQPEVEQTLQLVHKPRRLDDELVCRFRLPSTGDLGFDLEGNDCNGRAFIGDRAAREAMALKGDCATCVARGLGAARMTQL